MGLLLLALAATGAGTLTLVKSYLQGQVDDKLKAAIHALPTSAVQTTYETLLGDPHVELIHSVASDSALKQLEKHGTPDTMVLVEVNVAEEEGKAGIAPAELGAFIARCPVTVTGLMTMPPFAEDPEASRPHFAALKRLADEHGLSELSMGTSQDYRVAAEEGATIVRLGTILYA